MLASYFSAKKNPERSAKLASIFFYFALYMFTAILSSTSRTIFIM